MRRTSALFAAGAVVSLVQISGLNVGHAQTTFELPLAGLLLAWPYLAAPERFWVTIGAALPLDAVSILPFGTYTLAFGVTAIGVSLVCRRLPIREHRALLLVLVAVGSLTASLVVGLTASLAVWLRLGSWTPLTAGGPFARATALLMLVTVGVATLAVTVVDLARRRRKQLPHAAP